MGIFRRFFRVFSLDKTHPGNTRAGVGAIEIALDHLLDDRPEKTVLLLKASLIISQEPLEMIEHHPVEDRTLRIMKRFI
jgi:hypothetical protein